ncbi:MAG: DUF2059 domain-containing protein [Bryobacteraceae bacterium]|jgi:hypothetical protein
MKSLVSALVLGTLLLCSAAPILADEASKKAKIDEMLQLMHYDQTMKQMLEQMQSMQIEQLKKMDGPAEARALAEEIMQKVMALIADHWSYEKVKPICVQLYAEVFSEEEIDGIVSFYRSPAGKAMLEKMPQMMQRMMTMMQKLTGDLQPEIQKIAEEAKRKADAMQKDDAKQKEDAKQKQN